MLKFLIILLVITVSCYEGSASSYSILHSTRPWDENQKDLLQNEKIQILRYLSPDSLVVKVDSKKQMSDLGLHSEWRVRPYEKQQRISFRLRRWLARRGEGLQNLHVTSFEDLSLGVLNQICRGSTIRGWGHSIHLESATSNCVESLMDLPMVEFIEGEGPIESFYFDIPPEIKPPTSNVVGPGDFSDLSGYESGTRLMGFESFWQQGMTGAGELLAVADSGLDVGRTTDLLVDFTDAVKKAFVLGSYASNWEDPVGHGTHVMGLAVSRGPLSGKILRGGAYDAQLVVQSLWSPVFNRLTPPAAITNLFDTSWNLGVRVQSNSWGHTENPSEYTAEASEVDEFVWRHPEFLIVFAAGNSGSDLNKDGRVDPGSISPPATAKNVLTVGASENVVSHGGFQLPIAELKTAPSLWPVAPILGSKVSDHARGLAMFSARGPTRDGRTKPDLVAPGTNLLSNRSQVSGASELWGAYNDNYVFGGGTSMSAPLVAASALLLRQKLTSQRHLKEPSAALVKAILIGSTCDMYPGQYGDGGEKGGQEILSHRPNSDEGFGRVDLRIAARTLTQALLLDEKQGVATGETLRLEYHPVDPTQSLRATLVYTDYPASPAAVGSREEGSRALVNNLDLALVSPRGKKYEVRDATNNVEMVEGFAERSQQPWLIEVKGTAVPMGKKGRQPFALVVLEAATVNCSDL